jgi:hypothetical protein
MHLESQHLQTARTAFEHWRLSEPTDGASASLERSSADPRAYADAQVQRDWIIWLGGYTARQMPPAAAPAAQGAFGLPVLLVPPSDHADLETNLQEHMREAFERRRETPPLVGIDIFIAIDYYSWAWEDCIAQYGQQKP